MTHSRRVTLLFNANKAFDRKVLAGIAGYLSRGVDWDIHVEEDLLARVDMLQDWEGDGFIADFDNPDVVEFVRTRGLKAVGVGGSYRHADEYPQGFPYVASNNASISALAAEHFLSIGFRHLGFYGLPHRRVHRWAREREQAFVEVAQKQAGNTVTLHCYRGAPTGHARDWRAAEQQLIEWLRRVPKPIGIMAVTDSRGRQLLQACRSAGLHVPDEVAVLGVDDDEIIRGLTGNRLSSVRQGTERMGELAAQLLDQQFKGTVVAPDVHLVEPIGIMHSASSDFVAVEDEKVRDAMRYIRAHACDGIQTMHVLRQVGGSRTSLDARFKASLGSTVHQEIVREQIARVRQLLLQSALPLQEIATRTGYNTLQYMVMVFKKQTGMTPTAYRQRFS